MSGSSKPLCLLLYPTSLQQMHGNADDQSRALSAGERGTLKKDKSALQSRIQNRCFVKGCVLCMYVGMDKKMASQIGAR